MDGWMDKLTLPRQKTVSIKSNFLFFTDEEKLSICYLPVNFESGKYQKQKL
jgi:hypothetical protein